MSKPWLETKVGACVECGAEPSCNIDCMTCIKDSLIRDMCRALLAVETCPRTGACPYCDVWLSTGMFWHTDKCALDAALTKCGFDTKEKRDAARAKIKEMGL